MDFRPGKRNRYVSLPPPRGPWLRVASLIALAALLYSRFDSVCAWAMRLARDFRRPSAPVAAPPTPAAWAVGGGPGPGRMRVECREPDWGACWRLLDSLDRGLAAVSRSLMARAGKGKASPRGAGFGLRLLPVGGGGVSAELPPFPLLDSLRLDFATGGSRAWGNRGAAEVERAPEWRTFYATWDFRDAAGAGLADPRPHWPLDGAQAQAWSGANGPAAFRLAGLRIQAPPRAAIRPWLAGRVAALEAGGPGGPVLVLHHGGNYYSYYLHFGRLRTGLSPGTPVAAGDTLGETGDGADAWLGLAVRREGVFCDPRSLSPEIPAGHGP